MLALLPVVLTYNIDVAEPWVQEVNMSETNVQTVEGATQSLLNTPQLKTPAVLV